MIRKLWLAAVLLAAVVLLAGCDERGSIPPTCVGTGTVMLFREKNDDGQPVFDQSLSDFCSAHPELRMVSQRSLGGNGSTELKMVIFEVSPGAKPPVVNDPDTFPVEAK
jgi:hypothetical protein